MWTGSDVDFAVPMVETTRELLPDFCAVSFDRGIHSPANRARLDDLLEDNVLPKKDYLSKAERDREQGKTFAAMRCQHPAVESAINNLEHRGLDRVRSKGREGFAPNGWFVRRRPERAWLQTSAASARAGTTSSRSLRQAINEQPFPTRPLREPKGIPNDDQTEQKSLIGEDRVAKLALTRREVPHRSQNLE